MVPPNNLGLDLNGKDINETRCRGMIGSLMYLTASRPDIRFSTCLCARYQANPKESHLIAVKRIFRYLKGTPSLGMWYPKCLGFGLKGYSNSDYVGCNIDRKSTSGACQLLGGKLMCWSAKKQQSVAMSLAEAEYIAAVGFCANILWMKSQLTDYDIIYEKVPIFCDNNSAIAMPNNPVLHSRTKHIDIRYHFFRDHILKGDIEIHFIPTRYQLGDIFTKPLDEPTFKRLIVELGMLNIDSKPEASLNRRLFTVLGFDLKGYSDSDYAGCNMDRKSTSTEAEYVAAAGCCANILWIKSQLTNYNIIYEKVSIFCDNTSAIAISNNPVLHYITKHIDIKYHFIRDHILKWDIELQFIPTQIFNMA
ncbi:hypothetical protein Tco_0858618 [Tanacetum coccineum]|uniref:Copia protein n=1 Tax=Tanacetum coccineum TaxID=301880 RepID=A0ABQ5BAC7_9ASTR